MKKSIIAITLTTSLGVAAWSSLANADMYKSGGGKVYAGVAYNFMSIDDGWDELNVDTVSARIGVQPHPVFGIEARVGFGVDEHRLRGVDYALDSTFGAYAVVNMANQSPVTPYFLLGVSRVEIEANSSRGTTTEDDSGFSFGAGLEIEVVPGVSGNLEYMRYYSNETTTVDGLGLGMTFRF